MSADYVPRHRSEPRATFVDKIRLDLARDSISIDGGPPIFVDPDFSYGHNGDDPVVNVTIRAGEVELVVA